MKLAFFPCLDVLAVDMHKDGSTQLLACRDLCRLRGCNAVGLLGGTFDPVHIGHLHMAQVAMRTAMVENVLFIPTGDPPHKTYVANKAQRMDMLLAALAYTPFYATDIEVERGGKTYTVDTLRMLKDALPQVAFYYIIGADTLFELETWRDAEEVLRKVFFVCMLRQGNDRQTVLHKKAELEKMYHAKICIAPEAYCDVSSTDVRRRIAQGLSVDKMLQPCVADYIAAHDMYQDESYSLESANKKIKNALSERRYLHTMGTVHSALKLAMQYGEDSSVVKWAALLHDCAKEIPMAEALLLCDRYGITVTADMLKHPPLVHGFLGAGIAKAAYGMQDEGVLDAVRYHTVGRPGMTRLEKIIYLADYIEPGRTHNCAAQARIAAEESLDAGMVCALSCTVKQLGKENMSELSLDALSDLLMK